ncbi:hypothetical protein ABT174_37795 [Streptomyces sparsogenes]|uniref:hypothetical protein n=1 Tax=Streptomyces sparsogenes TaxID=67365 RepID=UPI00331B5A64
MSGGKGWWILVEAPVGIDSQWELSRVIPVDGGRDQAVAQAAELARKCDESGREVHDPEAYGRRVFRSGEADWLVEISHSYWSDYVKKSITSKSHVRISVAELEHQSEAPDAEPPAKGRLRRALGMS